MSRPLETVSSRMMGFHFDARLASNLDYWRNMTIKYDADCGGVIDGKEGSGKSVMAQQVGKYLDIDHEIDLDKQIVFSHEDFLEKINSLKKGKVIIYDEAGEGLDVRRSIHTTNMKINDMLRECRQRNLFFLLVIPSFYDLDKRQAVWRTRFLIHVYWVGNTEKKVFERGQFLFYTEDEKKNMYCNENSRKYYSYPMSQVRGRFPHHYVVDEALYRQKKREYSVAMKKKRSKPSIDPKVLQKTREESWADSVVHLDKARLLRPGAIEFSGLTLGVGKSKWYELLKDARFRIGLTNRAQRKKTPPQKDVVTIHNEKETDSGGGVAG